MKRKEFLQKSGLLALATIFMPSNLLSNNDKQIKKPISSRPMVKNYFTDIVPLHLKTRYFDKNSKEMRSPSFVFTTKDRLMGCVGIEDVNGKMLYEGDIIKSFYMEKTKGGYLDNLYSFDYIKYIAPSYIRVNEKSGGGNIGKYFEIIGNIYKNPNFISIVNENEYNYENTPIKIEAGTFGKTITDESLFRNK